MADLLQQLQELQKDLEAVHEGTLLADGARYALDKLRPIVHQAETQLNATPNTARHFEDLPPWVKTQLAAAIRQYRHNNDNSPHLTQPRQGFAYAYDCTLVENLVCILAAAPLIWRPIATAPCSDCCAFVLWQEYTLHAGPLRAVTLEDLDHDSTPDYWRQRGATHWAPYVPPYN